MFVEKAVEKVRVRGHENAETSQIRRAARAAVIGED
jgi:hypothetical protein